MNEATVVLLGKDFAARSSGLLGKPAGERSELRRRHSPKRETERPGFAWYVSFLFGGRGLVKGLKGFLDS